jgi:hypothetical protein
LRRSKVVSVLDFNESSACACSAQALLSTVSSTLAAHSAARRGVRDATRGARERERPRGGGGGERQGERGGGREAEVERKTRREGCRAQRDEYARQRGAEDAAVVIRLAGHWSWYKRCRIPALLVRRMPRWPSGYRHSGTSMRSTSVQTYKNHQYKRHVKMCTNRARGPGRRASRGGLDP